MGRFGVTAFPSIFFLKGGSTWVYEGARNVQEVRGHKYLFEANLTLNCCISGMQFKEFALTGHKKETSLPFWKSPTGLVGRMVGRLHRYVIFICDC